jgi:hypothetical protein
MRIHALASIMSSAARDGNVAQANVNILFGQIVADFACEKLMPWSG